jgi:hypothetical protein
VLEHLLRRLTVSGYRKGLAGSRGWLYVGIVATGVRMLRRVAREESVLYRTEIRAGDRFRIVTGKPVRR